jgi:predicted RNase H-like HicB family nuclease
MAEFQVVFDSAVARGIYDGVFVDFCRAVARGETPADPGGKPTASL